MYRQGPKDSKGWPILGPTGIVRHAETRTEARNVARVMTANPPELNPKDEQRKRELISAANEALRQVRAGNFVEASTELGKAQRRARLLAGLGRGG